MPLFQPSPADTLQADTIAGRADSLVRKGSATFRFTDEEDSVTEGNGGDRLRQTLEGPGLFKGHALRPIHPNARPVNREVADWFTLSLIALVGLFTWFRVFYYRIFNQLFTAFFNITTTNQIVRDESVLLQRASLFLSVISYMVMGLFVYQLSELLHWNIPLLQGGLLRFIFFSVAIAAAYSIKMIVLRFLSAVFNLEKAVALYIFNVFLMVMMVGLLLLPVNILLAYASAGIRHWTLLITTGLIALLFLYRLIRAAGIWTGIPGFSLFYLFLYLCAFEIAPLLIIWKAANL